MACSWLSPSWAVSDPLFDRERVRAALAELVEELVGSGASARIRVVGGAAVALAVGREGVTRDVDALFAASAQVRRAAQTLAERYDWPANWLNEDVKMFATHFDGSDDWAVEIECGKVCVEVARPSLLLAMKLLAGRGRRDEEDIERLIDACEVRSVQEADAIFARFYPEHEMAMPARRQLEDRFASPT